MKSLLIALSLLLLAMPAAAAETPELAQSICVLGSNNDCACGQPPDNVLTTDRTEIYAKASINATGSSNIEFVWFRPDGSVARRRVKTTNFNKNEGRYDAWDSVQHGGAVGWWRVEADYGGGKLSKEFLVTENRQVITLLTGTRYARLAIINGVDPEGANARDIIDIAMQDQDPVVRAAALSRLAGSGEQWALQDVRDGLTDRSDEVRLAALGVADVLTGTERKAAYLDSLKSKNPDVRIAGVTGLYNIGDEDAVSALTGALADAVPGIRLAALKRLEELKAPALAVHLKDLAGDDDRDVTVAALDAAIALDDEQARDAALVAAALSAHGDVSRRATDELLKSGGVAALPAYMRQFRDGYRKDDDLRAIIKVGGDEATDYIGEAYSLSAKDEPLRLLAVRGLSGRGAGAASVIEKAAADPSAAVRLAALDTARTLPDWPGRTAMLRSALADPDQEVSARALDMLCSTGSDEDFAAMMDAVDKPLLRDAALGRIAASGRPEVVAMLARKGLTITDPRLRRRVLASLTGLVASLETIKPYIRDSEPSVRAQAADVVRSVGGADAVRLLCELGKDPEPDVRVAARAAHSALPASDVGAGIALMTEKGELDAGSAGFIAEAATEPATLKLLVDSIPSDDAAALRAAVEPIAARKGDGYIAALGAGLKNADAALAGMLITRISASAGKAASDALADAYGARPEMRALLLTATAHTPASYRITRLALKDSDPSLRAGAVNVAAGLGNDAAKLVAGAMKDPDPGVRLEAAAAGGRLGLAEVLLTAAADSDTGVRAASAAGLSETGGNKAADALARLAMDKDKSVSAAGVSGLLRMRGGVPLSVWAKIAAGPAPVDARFAAAGALGSSRDKKAARPLAKLMASDDPRLADAAEAALVRLGRASLPEVYPLLRQEKTRGRALRLLGKLPDRASESRIVAVLPKLSGQELVTAIDALGRLGGTGSLKALYGIYRKADEALRETVLRSVSGLDVKGNEPELKAMVADGLKSPDEDLRFYAVRAAGAARVVSLKPELTAMMETEGSALVRRELERALGSF